MALVDDAELAPNRKFRKIGAQEEALKSLVATDKQKRVDVSDGLFTQEPVDHAN